MKVSRPPTPIVRAKPPSAAKRPRPRAGRGERAAGSTSRQLAAEREALRRALQVLPEETVRRLELARHPTKRGGGTSVKYVVEGGGQAFTFKPDLHPNPFRAKNFWPDSLYERDFFAQRMRQLAGEPFVPPVRRSVMIDGERLRGYVRQRLPYNGKLPSDARTWSRAQVHQVLSDAVWSEFLGNYDMKTDQYAVVRLPGGGRGAFAYDWDLSLGDYAREVPLSRHKSLGKNNPLMVPTAANLLFAQYVRGEVDLDFAAMRDAVKRIQSLPDAEVAAALRPFIEKELGAGRSFGPFQRGDQLVAAVLARKRSLSADFEALITSLQSERAQRRRGRLSVRRLAHALEDQRKALFGKLVTSPFYSGVNALTRTLNHAFNRNVKG